MGVRMKAVKVLHYLTWCPLNLSTLVCNCRGIYHCRYCTAPEELYGPGAGWLAKSTWVAVKMLCALWLCHDKTSGKWRDGERKETKWRLTAALLLPGLGGVSSSSSTLKSVSLMVIKREWPSPQLRFCGYPPDQILQEALLDTKKIIFKNNLLHSGSWTPLIMLKWSGFWVSSYVPAPLSSQGPGIYTPNCEGTRCWHCFFTGDEQRHRGCWDLAKVSQEFCGGCCRENSLKDGGQPPSTQQGEPRHRQIPMSESKGRALLWGRAKSHPWDIPYSSSFVQLCLSFTPLQRRSDLRSTQLLNIPEESVSFQESSAKTLMVCLRVRAQGGRVMRC